MQNPVPIFSGEFCHSLDPKNRVTIPAKWRMSEADEFFLMLDRTTKQCLRAMPPEQFRAVAEQVKNIPGVTEAQRKVFVRQFYSRAKQVVVDKQGRLLIPEELGSEISLQSEVVLVGTHETFELWSPEAWVATQKTEEAIFDQVADQIGL